MPRSPMGGIDGCTLKAMVANMKLTTPKISCGRKRAWPPCSANIRPAPLDVHAVARRIHLNLRVRCRSTRVFPRIPTAMSAASLVDAILWRAGRLRHRLALSAERCEWKGASSDHFLKYAHRACDRTLRRFANLYDDQICERPKIVRCATTMRAAHRRVSSSTYLARRR